jgi:hypothetical protein
MASYEVGLEIKSFISLGVVKSCRQRRLILVQLYLLFMWFRLSAASLQHLQAMAANLDGRFANDGFGGILFFLYY